MQRKQKLELRERKQRDRINGEDSKGGQQERTMRIDDKRE